MDNPGFTMAADEAIERIEESILPSLGTILDAALEAAALGRPGIDAEAHAAELRAIAAELEAMTRQVEALAPPPARYRRSGAGSAA